MVVLCHSDHGDATSCAVKDMMLPLAWLGAQGGSLGFYMVDCGKGRGGGPVSSQHPRVRSGPWLGHGVLSALVYVVVKTVQGLSETSVAS